MTRYIRFVVPENNPTSKSLLGVFGGAALLIEREDQPHYLLDSIKDELDWFNANLCEPTCFKDAESRPHKERGVCWFKDSSKDHLKHAWSLASLLQEAGVPIRCIMKENPGAVVFEDAHQIVAKPWRMHKDGVYRT